MQPLTSDTKLRRANNTREHCLTARKKTRHINSPDEKLQNKSNNKYRATHARRAPARNRRGETRMPDGRWSHPPMRKGAPQTQK